MKPYFTQSTEETALNLQVNISEGITFEEATKRLRQYGYNQLATKKEKTFLKMFFSQFRSFMIIILLVAAAVSGVVGIMEEEGLLDTFVIIGILILNAFIGAFQEKRAQASLEALKNLASAESMVLRSGNVQKIPGKELVPGDIVILETGSVIPADIRLTEAVNLKIKESSLTGESLPVDKTTEVFDSEEIPLGDRKNMAFSSGMVTYGRGRGIVVGTGMQTEVGKIAGMLQETEDTETPMSKRLEHLGKVLGIAALLICGVIFVVGILYGNSILHMFMTAVSLAVAAIPEGLPAVSTVVLAIGVQRLVKRNAIIRTLPAVETLGSATIICSDKTGTLTQNKMTVVKIYLNHKVKDIGTNSLKADTEEEQLLLHTSILCVDAQEGQNDEGELELTGDPTETALLDLGLKYDLHRSKLEQKFNRVAEIPFDSERKRMTTVNVSDNNKFRVNVKGGLDEILQVCARIEVEGKVRPITEDDIEKIRQANQQMAESALRVLAMAYKEIEEAPAQATVENLETDLIFIGMTGMIDPARPEVIDAVAKCTTAGIRPVMITGDHKITAMAIAKEIGIYREGDKAITGTELEKMDQETLERDVAKYSVYARVAPEHKVRIVKAWQKQQQVVAMTGDGVNDAPALKQADIGAAMGIVGTDVAKGASDMVLTDDNFATIVSAVEEGRRIYDNILKAIQFLLSTNVGEIFLLLVTSIFNMGIPLLPVHILWVNLVTDSLPALALSVDPAKKNIMQRKPINSKKGFMTRGMIWRVMYQGIMVGAIPLVAFIIGLRDGGETLGQTMAFSTLIFAQLVHVRNLHSNRESSFRFNPFKNKLLIGAIFASAGLALLVLLLPPMQKAFSITSMDKEHWLIVGLLSLIPIVVVEVIKLLGINGTRSENDEL